MCKRKKRENEEDENTKGWSWSRGETWTAVNFDSWPPSSGNSILMVVLRAEREEGWLILGYVTPPTLNCLAHAARLEMGKQSQRGESVWFQMCEGAEGVRAPHSANTLQSSAAAFHFIYLLLLYHSKDQLQHTITQRCICGDVSYVRARINKRGFLVKMSFGPLNVLNPRAGFICKSLRRSFRAACKRNKETQTANRKHAGKLTSDFLKSLLSSAAVNKKGQ